MEENRYFPIFNNWIEITSTLTDAEFGELIRALIATPDGEEPRLPDRLIIPYRFMLDGAKRVYQSKISEKRRENAKKRWSRDERGENKTDDGRFSPDEAFNRALLRTYESDIIEI